MENLKLDREKFVYRDAEVGDVMEVEVYYSKGGANYFAGQNEARGIRISIGPITIEITPSGGKMIGFGMFSAAAAVVQVLTRKNPKAIEAVAERVDPFVPQACKMWRDGEKKAAFDLLRQAVNA